MTWARPVWQNTIESAASANGRDLRAIVGPIHLLIRSSDFIVQALFAFEPTTEPILPDVAADGSVYRIYGFLEAVFRDSTDRRSCRCSE
jgi:hypothetical protein